MKLTLTYLFLAVSGLVAGAQPAASTNVPGRDSAGFLSTPVVPAESSLVPVAAPTVNVTNPTTGGEVTSASSYILDDKHKLMSGDVVSFQIVEDRTNAVHLLVAESSELDIPYIGRVSVAGRTCKQLANEIRGLLEKDYYHRATVIIGLDALTKVIGKVYVIGPVRAPGPIEIPSGENFTAGKAIMKAGGFGDFADKKNVEVIRKSATGTIRLKVNMKEVLENGKTESDIPLEPEDFIIVPQRSFNW